MKSIYFFLVATFFTAGVKAQSVAINTDGSVANESALLDLKSTTKGFLPPRMEQAQRNAISTPATGLIVYCTDCGSGEPQFYNGASWVNMLGGATTVATPAVTSSTGKIWMDRNLGATQVATGSADAASYGDLYQWGRLADGHQIRTSFTTSTLSSTDMPGNGNFITVNSGNDWRSPQNNNLWQGVNGTNNPCPTGFRLPTDTELNNERLTWVSNNRDGAFASVLKLPMAGSRDVGNGALAFVGSRGYYWSSTVSGTFARYLFFNSSTANMVSYFRAYAYSVRCLKD
jgi:hypothetical protein